MSEHEFEQFLAIFRGMLRLSPTQRDEIAAELMDHFQERLSELTDRGMSREQAVQTALEEFGDAAGLAAQFVLVVSQQRRRRVMKWTASSVMAAIVVMYGAYAFWPEDPVRGPALAPAIAQESPAPADAKKKKKDTAKAAASAAAKTDAIQEIESQLVVKMPADFKEVPLEDFLGGLSEKSKVDFYLDKTALEEVGVSESTPITIQLKSIRIDKLLDLILGQLDLAWLPRDGFVLVTSKEKLENTLETRVYNCRDLIELALFGGSANAAQGFPGAEGGMGMTGGYGGMAGSMQGMGGAPGQSGMGGMPGMGMSGMMGSGMDAGMMPGGSGMMGPGGMAAPGSGVGFSGASMLPFMGTLIEVVTTTVMPESWSAQGGSGAISAYHNGLLVVNHHPTAHRKIEQLLRMLRDASKDKPGSVVRER